MNSGSPDKTSMLYANIGKLITSSLELHEILEGIMEEIRIFFDPDHWSLMRLDHTTNKLFFTIIKGIDAEIVKNVRIDLGEGIAGRVAETGESIFVQDTSKDPRFTGSVDKITGFNTESIIAVPVIFRGCVYGVIELINSTKGGNFTGKEHFILQTIADFSAIAFANSYLYEQALSMSITDPLTGLLNHARLDSIIEDWEKTKSRLRRHEDQLSRVIAVFIDLDTFKEVNDNFGHMEGDRVLKALARLLENKFRSDDYLFRVGGDEFLVLIRVSATDNIEMLQQRLDRELRSIVIKSSEKNYTVTFSFGISCGHLHEIRNLIKLADKKMYELKDSKS